MSNYKHLMNEPTHYFSYVIKVCLLSCVILMNKKSFGNHENWLKTITLLIIWHFCRIMTCLVVKNICQVTDIFMALVPQFLPGYFLQNFLANSCNFSLLIHKGHQKEPENKEMVWKQVQSNLTLRTVNIRTNLGLRTK